PSRSSAWRSLIAWRNCSVMVAIGMSKTSMSWVRMRCRRRSSGPWKRSISTTRKPSRSARPTTVRSTSDPQPDEAVGEPTQLVDRRQEEVQHARREEDHRHDDEQTVAADLAVAVRDLARQQVRDDVRAVERRNRHQVEERQDEIDG